MLRRQGAASVSRIRCNQVFPEQDVKLSELQFLGVHAIRSARCGADLGLRLAATRAIFSMRGYREPGTRCRATLVQVAERTILIVYGLVAIF